MLHPGASGALDKSRLPVYGTFRDGRQQKRFFNALQGRIECLGLIKVAHSQLDARALQTRSLRRIAHERANGLPHSGQLSDKFLSVISSCSSDQYHGLPLGNVVKINGGAMFQAIRNPVLGDFWNQSTSRILKVKYVPTRKVLYKKIVGEACGNQSHNCPVEAIDVIGGKWKPLILW